MKPWKVAALLMPAVILAGCSQSSPEANAQPLDEPIAELQQTNPMVAAESDTKTPDVVYVPTPQPVVEAMLKLAKVQKGDVLYDLGSGDGRIPITAAREYGIRSVGIDIDPKRVAEAKANVEKAGVGDLVEIRQGDLFEADFSEASVVTLYLLDRLNEKLRPKLLAELKPGSRIVSHAFRMGDWEPEAEQNIDGSMIYLWTVPERK
jgi:precorrin-6B methylase 2